MKTNVMTFQLYPTISSGKQDIVREVVMKYIDYFYPDASGTSAVAIDNKIEQAMDLVKSHLMIAVREEVEVLKEKISELMDKINQLEVENTILKANVSQETLHQLQLAPQGQIVAGNGTNNMIATAPSSVTAPTVQQQQQQQTSVQQSPSQSQLQQQQQQSSAGTTTTSTSLIAAANNAANGATTTNTSNGPMS